MTSEPPAARGWGPPAGEATTLLLARHGATALTAERRFSGVRGDPDLTAQGREQARALGQALFARGGADAVVSSPLRRARETADLVASVVDAEVVEDEGWRETDFGDWEGFTFADVARQWPDDLEAWLASTSVAPPGGECFDEVALRVRRTRERLVQQHPGRSLVVVTHVTPVKVVVCEALGAPLPAIYRMELDAGALTSVAWYADGNASLRSFNVVSSDR